MKTVELYNTLEDLHNDEILPFYQFVIGYGFTKPILLHVLYKLEIPDIYNIIVTWADSKNLIDSNSYKMELISGNYIVKWSYSSRDINNYRQILFVKISD